MDSIKALLENTQAPLNRYFRYPICYTILKPLRYTPLTPNQVSIFHCFLGLFAAYLLTKGTPSDLILAAILYEVRMILDCFDGVLARWKNMASIYGRHIDEVSDVVSFLGLMVGSYVYLTQTKESSSPILVLLLVSITLFSLTTVFDFYYRKISSALLKGEDGIRIDLYEGFKKAHSPDAGIFERMGFRIDLVRLSLLSSKLSREIREELKNGTLRECTPEVAHIQAQKDSPQLKKVLQWMGYIGGDNSLFLINLGLISNQLLLGLWATIVVGIITGACTVLRARKFLNV